MKRKLAIVTGLAFLFLATASANIAPLNEGFEDGDLEGWTSSFGDNWDLDDNSPISGDYSLVFNDTGNDGYQTSFSDKLSSLEFKMRQEKGMGFQRMFYQPTLNTPTLIVGSEGSEYDSTMPRIAYYDGNEYITGPRMEKETVYHFELDGINWSTTTIGSITVNDNEIWSDVNFGGTDGEAGTVEYFIYSDSEKIGATLDDVTTGSEYIGPPEIESHNVNTPLMEGDSVSFSMDAIDTESAKIVVSEDGNEIINQDMEMVEAGSFEANDVFTVDEGGYTYTIVAENQFGETSSVSDTFTVQTPSFIVGQKVEGSISDTFNVTPDYEYKDGDVTYYYTKDYVYHDGSVVEESNWNRIDNFGSYTGEQTEKTISNEINRDAESTGDYSVETKLVEVSSTYEWDQNNDGVLDDSQGWEPYDTETVGTIRYNYQVVKAMETPSALDALGNFFDSILDGMISTITDIFSSEPTAVPNPNNPPVPSSN